MTIQVSKSQCPKNHICPAIRSCPVEAISQVGYGLPIINMDKCIECKKCIKFCPRGAIYSTN